jgi:hypothetical protein
MHRARLLIIIIGIFGCVLSHAQQMVTVEPDNIIQAAENGRYLLKPYLERRGDWGATVSIGASSYTPVNYQPDFLVGEFGDVYHFPSVPMIELTVVAKRNLTIGSVGAEVGVGFYSNDSANEDVDSTLQLIPIRLGASYMMDALSSEPYFAPYISGGAYIMLYKESDPSRSLSGNTQVAPYVRGGIAFSLDWIDRDAARISYEDSGIQKTYAYLEASKMFAAGGTADPDFEDDISFGLGFRVEF